MHQFIGVSELDKDNFRIKGAEVVCALCGEVRHIWADGTVDILVPKYDKCRPTSN